MLLLVRCFDCRHGPAMLFDPRVGSMRGRWSDSRGCDRCRPSSLSQAHSCVGGWVRGWARWVGCVGALGGVRGRGGWGGSRVDWECALGSTCSSRLVLVLPARSMQLSLVWVPRRSSRRLAPPGFPRASFSGWAWLLSLGCSRSGFGLRSRRRWVPHLIGPRARCVLVLGLDASAGRRWSSSVVTCLRPCRSESSALGPCRGGVGRWGGRWGLAPGLACRGFVSSVLLLSSFSLRHFGGILLIRAAISTDRRFLLLPWVGGRFAGVSCLGASCSSAWVGARGNLFPRSSSVGAPRKPLPVRPVCRMGGAVHFDWASL